MFNPSWLSNSQILEVSVENLKYLRPALEFKTSCLMTFWITTKKALNIMAIENYSKLIEKEKKVLALNNPLTNHAIKLSKKIRKILSLKHCFSTQAPKSLRKLSKDSLSLIKRKNNRSKILNLKSISKETPVNKIIPKLKTEN